MKESIYINFIYTFLKQVSTPIFIFENVKGLLSFRDADDEFLLPRMKKEFEEAGYSLGYEVLNTKTMVSHNQERKILLFFGVMNEKKNLFKNSLKILKNMKKMRWMLKPLFRVT